MYEYVGNNHEENRPQVALIRKLEKAINGEYSAIQCYEKIAKRAPNETERKQILEIREDEIKHFQVFSQLYINLTGNQPNPKVMEECPNSYKAGLEFAIQDEQETVDFYLETADGATDRSVRKAFRRAAADEQNHAVWFLYYFVKNK